MTIATKGDMQHPHAVSALDGNAYEYDANGNQTTRVVDGQTLDLDYDAEGHLVSVSDVTSQGMNLPPRTRALLAPPPRPLRQSAFPSTPLLDNFNRANGGLGANWGGSVSGYTIVSNQVDVGDGRVILWQNSYGTDQEAYITLTNVDADGDEHNLALKSQSATNWTAGVIEVWYDAIHDVVEVWTYSPSQGWAQRDADIPVTFNNGDQMGARAKPDGIVEVYKNGVLVGSADVSGWSFNSATTGGYIGFWFVRAADAIADDFGGGNVFSGPARPALDDFNRANGSLGANWGGSLSGYAIVSTRVDVGTGGVVLWQGASYGADQEAYITLTNVDADGTEHNLALKSQSATNWTAGVIDVWYDAVHDVVEVWTYSPAQGWAQRGADIPVMFSNGEQMGARAKPDGIVEVYKNGALVGLADVGEWSFDSASTGGYIGFWCVGAADALLIGSADVSGWPKPSITPSPSPGGRGARSGVRGKMPKGSFFRIDSYDAAHPHAVSPYNGVMGD